MAKGNARPQKSVIQTQTNAMIKGIMRLKSPVAGAQMKKGTSKKSK